MLYLGIKMQRNGDLTNHIKERMKIANVVVRNRRKKVSERLQKKDDAVRLSGCGSHVVQVELFGWNERENSRNI